MKTGIVTENRKARHNYEFDTTIEAGLVLTGTEVKSLREGGVNLKDAYARIENGEVFLVGCHISPYSAGNRLNHPPERPRKLLLKKREIKHLTGKLTERGYSLIPLKLYFNPKGIAKVLLGLGRGRARYDKRRVIKERDTERDVAREMSRYGRE
ncbi:SsrA-binding protein SmpB [bacterium]|nr:SsrA-binding protein SmpB [candidate division CSSED10-310 bacterium]